MNPINLEVMIFLFDPSQKFTNYYKLLHLVTPRNKLERVATNEFHK